MNTLLRRLEQNRKERTRWIALVLCLSMLVSLGTFATLHKTAVAQTYTRQVLDCPYMAEGAPPVAHVHNDDCYDEDGKLVCTLPLLEAHVHDDSCYEIKTVPVCGLEENPGHIHDDSCYRETSVNICGLEENDGHQHSDACYTPERGELICESEDENHQHDDSCYEWNNILTCGKEEGEGAHHHSDDCYQTERELICGLQEGEGAHAHSEACYETERVLTCGREELALHVHDANCIKTVELTREEVEEKNPEETAAPEASAKPEEDKEKEEKKLPPEKPWSDFDADLETAADWERDFDGLILTGDWARDLIAVAETQFGNRESDRNFDAILNEKGDDYDRKGWTRYGAWYGIPYGDWCAMFVSFCLNYAEIPESSFPYDCATTTWVRSLRELDMYADASGYTPKPGDVIFFDWEGDALADHVGLVYEVDEAGNYLRTIEGNHTSYVEAFDYTLDDWHIMGYGILPENPNPDADAHTANQDDLTDSSDSAEETENNTDAETEDESEEPEKNSEDESEAETEPAVPMPAQSFEKNVGGILVRVEADEGAFPEGTMMSVTPVNGNMLKTAVADVLEGEVLEVQAVDICFLCDGVEIEPMIPIRVSITPDHSVHEEQATHVVHIDDAGGAELIEQAEDAEPEGREVVFDADSFSVYAVVYTVDFEYASDGGVYRYSIPGGGNILLSELFDVLKIKDDVANVATVEFSDPTLLAVFKAEEDTAISAFMDAANAVRAFSAELTDEEILDFGGHIVPAGDWVLVSLKAFDTEETLTVKLIDGQEFVVRVTDEQHVVNDVTELLTDVKIDATFVDGKYVVYEGQPYGIHLTFKENPNGGQLNMTDGFNYPLPEGIDVTSASGTIKIKLSGGTQAGKEVDLNYTVQGGKLVFSWPDQTSDAYNQLKDALYTGFTVDIEGLFKSDKTTLKFSDTITKELDVKSDGKADVNKTGTYNPATNSVDYTVTVTSHGICQNVAVQDTISGNALTYNNDAKATSSTGAEYTPNTSGNGFSFTIPKMGDGETVTVKYSAAVDLTKLTKNDDGSIGTVEQTGNKVKVTPSNHPGDEDETSGKDFSNKISYSTISKGSSVGETGENGHATVTWTIKANDYANVSMAGHTISDQIAAGSQDIMKYSGTGITVVRRDSSGRVVGTETIPWSNLTSKTDSAWTWTVPASDTEKYSYEITYTTDVDVSGKLFNTQVSNTSSSDNGGSSSAGGEIKPAGGALAARKTVVSRDLSNKTITWEVSFDVPATGLDSAKIVDTLPIVWGQDGKVKYVDAYKAGTITVTPALEAGEGFNVTQSTDADTGKQFVNIEFYKLIDGEQQNGLLGTGSKRKIRVQFQTDINEDWLADAAADPNNYDLKTHKNEANVILNGQTLSTQASTQIEMTEPGMSKRLDSQSTQYINGIGDMPAFEYTVLLTGLSADAFDENGQIILEDTYNGKYLTYFTNDKFQSGDPASKNGYLYGSTVTVVNNGATVRGPYIVDDAASFDGYLRMVLNYSDFTVDNGLLNSDGSFKPYYFVHYYLVVKDAIALEKLTAAAAQSDGGKVALYNTVTNDYFGEEENKVDYEVPVIDKTAGNAEWKNGNWVVHYTIKVNENALQLGDEDELTLTDDYTNISVDYTTVKIYKGEGYSATNKVAADNVSWNRKGNVITYYLQNKTAYVIEYDAKITGTGKVTYTNTAEIFGVKDTETHDITISSSGSGDSPTYGIQIFKHEKGAASTPLQATFKLLEYTGTWDDPTTRPTDTKGEAKDGWEEIGSVTTNSDGIVNTATLGSLKHSTWYALWETSAPNGYEAKTFSYVFWITEGTTPDYSKYVYVNDDVVAIDNSPSIPDTVNVTVTKAWPNDPEDTHAPVTVHLYADGDPIADHVNDKGEKDITRNDGTISLGTDGNWNYTWTGLPGGPVYSVVEDAIPGYTTTYSPRNTQGLDGNNTITISNKKIPNKTSIGIQKNWAAGATETEDITVQLKRKASPNAEVRVVRNDGTMIEHFPVPVGSTISIYFVGTAPTEYSQEIYEYPDGVKTYVRTEYTYGGGNRPAWKLFDGNTTEGTPIREDDGSSNLTSKDDHIVTISNITVGSNGLTLYFPGDYGGYLGSGKYDPNLGLSVTPAVTATGGGTGEGIEDVFYTNERHYYTLNADNNWSLVIDRLPLSDDDGSYTYYIEEVGVNDNTQTPEEAGYVVTYENNGGITEGTIQVTNKNETVDAEFTKNWVNTENRGESSRTIDNTARLRIEAQLVRGYENESGEWVKIEDVGESVILYGDTTTYASHPESYPSNYSETTNPKQGSNWSAKWEDLPAKGTYNGETVTYVYHVEEKKIYTTSSIDSAYNDMLKLHIFESETSNDGSSTNVTNTFKTSTVEVKKKWEDENGTAITPAEGTSVTVQLQRRERDVSRNYDYSGEIFPGEWRDWENVIDTTLTLNSENEWKGSFSNLPKFGWRQDALTDNQFSYVEYEYQVVETGVTINGAASTDTFTTSVVTTNVGQNDKLVIITNTKEDKLIVKKIWGAGVAENKKNPVTIHLMRTTDPVYSVSVLIVGDDGKIIRVNGNIPKGQKAEIKWQDSEKQWSTNGVTSKITVIDDEEKKIGNSETYNGSTFSWSGNRSTNTLTISKIEGNISMKVEQAGGAISGGTYSINNDSINPILIVQLEGNDWDTDWKLIGKNDIKDDNGNVVSLAQNSSDGNKTWNYYILEKNVGEGFTTTYSPLSVSQNGTLTVTNSKEESQPSGVPLNIVKVDKNNNTTRLSGAEFSVWKLDESTAGIHPQNQKADVNGTTDNNGELTLTLPGNGYYEIKETKNPTGYVLATDATFYIKVDGQTITYLTADANNVPGKWGNGTKTDWVEYNSDNSTFTVGNVAGVELPMTGGFGTDVFRELGGMLTLAAGAVLTLRRRKKTA